MSNEGKDVVLKAQIHCQGCAKKISFCLKGIEGIEEVQIDTANNRVTVKGKRVDPQRVLERMKKKYSRNVELLSPKLNQTAPANTKKEPEKKQEQLQIKTSVFKMSMHCEGCVNDIKRMTEAMQGILSVEPEMKKSLVTVKGAFDPQKLVKTMSRKLGKHVEIVKQEQQEKGKDNNSSSKKGGIDGGGSSSSNNNTMFHYPPQYSNGCIYPPMTFSDENVFSCSLM